MRVLHIMSGFGGGISMFIQNEARGIQRFGIPMDVVTYDDVSEEFKQAIAGTGGRVYRMYNPKTEGWKKFIEEFQKVLQNQYEVVHCHISGYRALPYYWLVRQAGIKRFYLHAHTAPPTDTNFKQFVMTQLEQRMNRWMSRARLGCGSDAVDYLFGNRPGRRPTYMIPNSIDVHRFIHSAAKQQELRQTLRHEYGIDQDVFVIGQIGRLSTVKNHQKSFDIIESFRETSTPVQLLVIGTGDSEEPLKQAVMERDLEQQVTFLGRVEPISAIYPMFDAMLLPSFYEGFPTVAIESQAAGIPIIMSGTITREVDLNLNLVKRIPLEANARLWQAALMETRELISPPPHERLRVFEALGFSIEGSSQLYKEFLLQERETYTLGDSR